MVERKLFLQIQSINSMHPNAENMIVVPITKGIEIITNIQVCLIPWMNFYYKENGKKKAFLAIPKQQYRVSQYGEHDCHASNKKKGDYYGYPSLSHCTGKL